MILGKVVTTAAVSLVAAANVLAMHSVAEKGGEYTVIRRSSSLRPAAVGHLNNDNNNGEDNSSSVNHHHDETSVEEKDRELLQVAVMGPKTVDAFIEPFAVVLEPTPYELYRTMYHNLYEDIFYAVADYIREKLHALHGYSSDAYTLDHIFLGHIEHSFDKLHSKTTVSVNAALITFTVNLHNDFAYGVETWIEEAINTRLHSALEGTPFYYVQKCTYVS